MMSFHVAIPEYFLQCYCVGFKYRLVIIIKDLNYFDLILLVLISSTGA